MHKGGIADKAGNRYEARWQTHQLLGLLDGTVQSITIEALDLPPGVTAPTGVSEPEGPTASKVTLTFMTTGPAFSGPIRICGTADEPRKIKRFARTPPRYATSVEAIWLTVIAKPDQTD